MITVVSPPVVEPEMDVHKIMINTAHLDETPKDTRQNTAEINSAATLNENKVEIKTSGAILNETEVISPIMRIEKLWNKEDMVNTLRHADLISTESQLSTLKP